MEGQSKALNHLEQLVATIGQENRLQREFLKNSLAGLQASERESLNQALAIYLKMGIASSDLARSYNRIVQDTLAEQIYFRRYGKYRHSQFSEVSQDVYFSPDYMQEYMLGLALTQFLWPNHRQLRRYFQERLPTGRQGTYFEIGPGHGLQFLYAMQNTCYDHFIACDISETSLQLTLKILRQFEVDEQQMQLLAGDFLEMSIEKGPFEALVMGEVLEHVEQPLLFLKKIKELTHADSFIFITTCANAPAIDHIYLFETSKEVEQLVQQAGLAVVDVLNVPYEGKTLSEAEAMKLPVNIAMVLTHEQ